ncbi:MAG TPA: type II secretion system protein N [Burkholderiaceae bacterium]|nr:type II secretion system protein N [Burkholderiaceae bacterium]
MARISIPYANRAPWRWALAGAGLGLLLALSLFAPASWLAAALADGSGGRVTLADARGTVWSGSARLVLSGGSGSRDTATLSQRVEWRIRPAAYGLSAGVLARCCMAQPWQLQARLRWGGMQLAVSDANSQWPAALLAGLGTPWNTLQPEGQLALSTQGVSADWNAGRLTLNGRMQLDLEQVSSRLSTLRPIGSYRVIVQGGPTATLRVETLEGSLHLSGNGQWVGSRLRFEGIASAEPDRVDALSNLLNIIGRRDGARAIIKVG